MKAKMILLVSLVFLCLFITVKNVEVLSPDEHLSVNIDVKNGIATYSVKYDNEELLLPSRLGLKSNIGDFSEGLTLKSHELGKESKKYNMTRTKSSHSEFNANKLEVTLENGKKHQILVTFLVSNTDVAFRYTLLRQENDNPKCAVIFNEVSSFLFPEGTTTFISPQSDPMIGFERSKPSYEEEYSSDAKMGDKSQYGKGYVFPALFHIGNHGWALIGETGVTSGYVCSHLSDFSAETG